jgi:hypothetical protein
MQKSQDYVKKTEATAKDVEQQLQQSEKRRCGAEEELKLIAGQYIVISCRKCTLTTPTGEVVLMRTRAAESAGGTVLHRNCKTPLILCDKVELETRTQAFAIEREAAALAASEAAASVKALQIAVVAAEAQVTQQARELLEAKVNNLQASIETHI